MARVLFRRETDTARLLSPLTGFARVQHPLELRWDPLLGHTAIVNPALSDKAGVLYPSSNRAWLAAIAEESRAGCVLCPERLGATPRFEPALVPEGRIQVGEAVVMPNLFPLARHHAVAVVSRGHFLELPEFTPERVRDALLALQRLATAIVRQDAESRHLIIAANYLFPAGASLVHAHLQLLASPAPHAHQAALHAAWNRWWQAHGTAFADDLLAKERALGERYIGHTGGWHWLAAFAPLGLHEIQAVHETAAHFAELAEDEVAALAAGLSRALRLYDQLGHISFNFALYSQNGVPGARLFLRLIARQHPAPAYRNDDYFLQRLLGTELILLPPEELARRAIPLFA